MRLYRAISVGKIMGKIRSIQIDVENYYQSTNYILIDTDVNVYTILTRYIYFDWHDEQKDFENTTKQLNHLSKLQLFEIYQELSKIKIPTPTYEKKKNFIDGVDRISGKTFSKIPRNTSSQQFRNNRIKH